MIYVIGSGPAGVASAIALIRQGLRVTMLDVGKELEPDRLALVGQLGQTRPENWDAKTLEFIKGNSCSNASSFPMKLCYGSDFPYREAGQVSGAQSAGGTLHSFARGGLSNVWGAAVMPYSKGDIADWPISHDDLVKHYESVSSFMPIACAKRDDLHDSFPSYSSRCQPLSPTKQAIALMEDLASSKVKLNAQGIYFGYSRLAVRTFPGNTDNGCEYCGLCMYGCPYKLIYNSTNTLDELQKLPGFRYVKDVLVKKIVEVNGEVKIKAESTISGEQIEFLAKRVYLACGVLSTAKIMLESLEAYDYPLKMLDSQYFLFPFLRFGHIKGVTNERLQTLAQIFIEIADPDISPHTIHLQVYTYSDIYLRTLQEMLGKLYSTFKFAEDILLGRLCAVQGYLHSDVSNTFLLRLRSKAARPNDRHLLVEMMNRSPAELRVRRLLAKVQSNAMLFKGVPISFLLKFGSPGNSCFHSGGTFPMRYSPAAFQSDCLGRPFGYQKVHIVDASVFPSIPATTITFTVMANAHRIASLYHET